MSNFRVEKLEATQAWRSPTPAYLQVCDCSFHSQSLPDGFIAGVGEEGPYTVDLHLDYAGNLQLRAKLEANTWCELCCLVNMTLCSLLHHVPPDPAHSVYQLKPDSESNLVVSQLWQNASHTVLGGEEGEGSITQDVEGARRLDNCLDTGEDLELRGKEHGHRSQSQTQTHHLGLELALSLMSCFDTLHNHHNININPDNQIQYSEPSTLRKTDFIVHPSTKLTIMSNPQPRNLIHHFELSTLKK